MTHAATAVLANDLPGAIIDRLQRIKDSGRAVVQWANVIFVAPTGGMFRRAALHAQLTLIATKVMAVVAKGTSDALETQIWLRGFKATIEDSDDVLAGHLGEMIPQVESLQDSMQTLRAATIKLKDVLAVSTKSPSLRSQRLAAFHRYLAVQADGYAVLEAARWAILEREADADIKAGRVGQTFTSAADMMASLGD